MADLTGNDAKAEDQKPNKTAVACSTCRVKRQKCDGQRPRCSYCAQNELECVYSEKRKKRGPPPGYLARIADRTRLLEYFIGYLSSREGRTSGTTSLVQSVQQFTALLKNGHEDQKHWSRWNVAFHQYCGDLVDISLNDIDMPASHESSQKSGVKRARSVSPTPDAANTGGASKTQKNRSVTKTGRSNSSVTNGSRPGSIAHERSEPTTFVRQQFMGPAGSGYFNAPEYGRDSSRNNYALDPVIEQSHRGPMGSMGMGMGTGMFPSVFDDANEYVDVGPSRHSETADRSKNRVTFGDIAQTEDGGLMHDDIAEPEDRAGDDFKSGDGPSTAIDRQPFDLNYTSGFWRTADVEDLARSPRQMSSHTTPKIQLPPKDVQDHLIDTYLLHIQPQMPLLDPAQLSTYRYSTHLTTGSDSYTPPSRILMMALCAYSACFSPTLGGAASSVAALGDDNAAAGGILADIWYEEARSMLLSSTLRKRCGLDTVQAIVLMAMREHGKGQDFQAWLLLGIAIRCGQDLNMHVASRRPTKESRPSSLWSLRKAMSWRCMCMLDLQLALQLGRPPAISFSDRELPVFELYGDFITDDCATNRRLGSTGLDILSVFDASHALLKIVWNIQQKLYLGGKPHARDVAPIEQALEKWHDELPKTLVVHLGGRPSLGVVCLHLLHQTAVLLLFRPFQEDPAINAVEPMSLATTTSKALLYVLQNSLSGETTVAQCQPQVVYMIFTIAVGFMCTLRGLKDVAGTVTKSLDTQIALHSCSEALSRMAETWPLAKKYGRAVKVLMDAERLESLESRSTAQRDSAVVEPGDRRTQAAEPSRSDRTTQQLGALLGGPTNGMNDTTFNNQPANHQPFLPTSVGALLEQFPSFEDITGTTGWGTENLDNFDFSGIPFDRNDPGFDPELSAFLSSFAAVPGVPFPTNNFGPHNSSQPPPFAPSYGGLPANHSLREEGAQPYDAEHMPGHALDLLAYSAVNRQTK